MAKKNFSKGIDAFFSTDSISTTQENEPPQENILPSKIEKRATFLIEIEQLDKLKALAYWERKIHKQVLKEALDKFFLHKGEEKIKEALENYRNAGLQMDDSHE
jgi:hypothetical protein